MTAKPMRDEKENWTQDFSTYFWRAGGPFEVKFEMEKTLGLLLGRDTTQTAQLTYSGSDIPPTVGREVQLRFEAALQEGNWYSLRVKAWVPRAWYTQAEFRAYAERSFGYQTRDLQTAPTLGVLDASLRELYDRRVQEAVDGEARRGAEKEDPALTTALQKEILAGLRDGKSFRTAHHEGGTSIYFDGKDFVCSKHGEEESFEVLGTEGEALDRIKQLYDWESRKGSFPHLPPESEVWRFIRRQLV
jgi:hypothetical protein